MPRNEVPARDGAYVRVSAVMGREDERFISPDLQLQAINRARAAAPGPRELVETWQDIDVSGGSMDRPDLSGALDAARTGRIDHLWVYNLGRWARDTIGGLTELERIEAAGCKVMSTSETVDLGTPEGYFSATLMLAVYKLQRDQIGRSWRHVRQHRAETGTATNGVLALGYRRAETGQTTRRGRPATAGPPEVDPRLGAAVRRVFTQHAGGVTMREIRDEFSRARGKPTPRQTIRRMLANPFYLGKIVLNGKVYDGGHDPLVDDDTWQRVQRRLARDATTPSRTLEVAHELSGFARCGHCQRGAYVTRDDELVMLRCGANAYGYTCRGFGSPSKDKVVAAVLDRVQERIALLMVDQTEQAETRARRARARSDAVRLRRELAEVQAARGRLGADRARRRITDDQYQHTDAALAEEEQALTTALAAAEPSADTPAPRVHARLVDELMRLWPDATIPEKNRALRTVVQRVWIRRAEYRGQPLAERVDVELL